ncbi:uncharacterized protein CLAFUR5_08037 [Fulvia fulva]|uniref:Uncharacterized protein n=1 Tax=Passalora fulva TaxID=5499 RepID=A0A9Q8LEQ0_PASFU|nr:uncharacterized protein CLAFUR5_08037 [Fulvia fulva]KAK4630072.1 hypothetical protein CLAFUR0_07915 [Fulvia fulva]UJO15323.1 hypothetical protein CLAFUR5_08037 [Fulvia fulva]
MAPAKEAINTTKLSFTVAQKVCTPKALEQLACAFLATEDLYAFDKDKAAREFGGAKPDSFKRQIWVMGKKIKDAMDSGVTGDEGEGEAPVKEKAKGRKREGGWRGGCGCGWSEEEGEEGEGGCGGGSSQ